jgi:hypothetical protein
MHPGPCMYVRLATTVVPNGLDSEMNTGSS